MRGLTVKDGALQNSPGCRKKKKSRADPAFKLNLTNKYSKEFYCLLVDKIHADEQTGVKRWNIEIP